MDFFDYHFLTNFRLCDPLPNSPSWDWGILSLADHEDPSDFETPSPTPLLRVFEDDQDPSSSSSLSEVFFNQLLYQQKSQPPHPMSRSINFLLRFFNPQNDPEDGVEDGVIPVFSESANHVLALEIR
ncbi:hypothetical protein CTI12_AA186000 [Artemisia annua]|uniref:Uncharacterized protein n=1 Tax=Artemisia annua TaxID=35608 RepID=A0A2U1P756_ARTAN|nr:hypothetical protein CTI12_AA186000 [Artemisia annua]